MHHFLFEKKSPWCSAQVVYLFSAVLLTFSLTGCGGSASAPSTSSTSQSAPQTYMAPFVVGTTNGKGSLGGPEAYSIDDSAKAFSQASFLLNPPQQQGPQTISSGVLSAMSRGLLAMGMTSNYLFNSLTNKWDANVSNPPKPGGFAIELADQAGGLVQLVGQPAAPMVAAVQCPSLSTPQSYLFLTIPGARAIPSPTVLPYTWSPAADTAYGSVDISTTGNVITFNNIHQFTLPSSGGTGLPSQPSAPSVNGACAQTFLGSTISLPAPLIITNPGEDQTVSPSATVGIGPSGLLVEDNGLLTSGATTVGNYQNALGAGTGAVGLPKPSSALNTGALLGAQYLGFVYGAGKYNNTNPPAGWSSHLASFGFSSAPSTCASVAASSSTLIYGGSFAKDDPSTAANGFGDCNLAIDLGVQDASTNGLYSHATVWMGAGYPENLTGKAYSFSTVAIAGQLKGKFAIFLLGVDENQPWAIYLLQSN